MAKKLYLEYEMNNDPKKSKIVAIFILKMKKISYQDV